MKTLFVTHSMYKKPEVRTVKTVRMPLEPCLKIGVVGYFSQAFDEAKAYTLLESAIREISKKIKKGNIIIASGLTNAGMNKVAYDLAEDYGYLTAGIACAKSEKGDNRRCDIVKISGNDWGDESHCLIDFCDAIIRVGGGKQSLKEVRMAKEAGKLVIEHELPALES